MKSESHRAPSRRSSRGFTLVELLIAVAVIGILAAIALVNLMDALQRSRQSRTMASMRNLGSAVQAYDSDNSFLPQNGLTAQELVTVLQSNGLFQNVEYEDGWGFSFQYTANGTNYSLESYGADGADGPADMTRETRTDYRNDIVLVDGRFVASPEN